MFIITPRSEGTYFIVYLLCIKQLLSNFELQNGEKNKQLLGLGPSQVAFKKSVVRMLTNSTFIVNTNHIIQKSGIRGC